MYCEVIQWSKAQGHLNKILTKFWKSDDCFLNIICKSKKNQSILHQSILQSPMINFTIEIVSAVNHKFKGQGHIKVK